MAGDSKEVARAHLADAGVEELPDDWDVVTLGDLFTEDRGIAVGVMYPGDHDPDGVPLIKAGDLNGSIINPQPDFRISKDKHHEYRRTALEGGELLMTLVGNVGQCAVVPPRMAGWNTARAVAVMRLADSSETHFVQQCLLSRPLQHLMDVWCNTTVQATLNLKEIRQLPLPWPPKKSRDAIAAFGKALDDKIELNRRMNATLEAMARALFQSWFVDFDPVRAKLDGRPPAALDPATAALFPASFDETAAGHIPHGWRVGSIYEIANVIYGAPFASSLFNSEKLGKPLIRIRDLPNESPAVFTTEMHPKGYLLQPGDIAVGMDGEFRAYLWAGVESWLNQRVCVFAPKPGYSAAFVRNSIIAPLAQVEATETATTVIHIGKNDIDRFTVIIPDAPVAEAFKRQCQPWYYQIVANKQQSRTLATLRDTLLPKLLSGELSVEAVSQT
jgi:type I restriction enzyme, S subunit